MIHSDDDNAADFHGDNADIVTGNTSKETYLSGSYFNVDLDGIDS